MDQDCGCEIEKDGQTVKVDVGGEVHKTRLDKLVATSCFFRTLLK